MKKFAWLLLLVVFVLPRPIAAQEDLHYTGFVNDFAGIISEPAKAAMETRLRVYAQQTTIEIAVVTVKSLNGLTIEDFAQRLFRSWGIGKKDIKNGVLFLHAPNERKMRIHTGYAIEPDLTDIQAKIILDEQVKPLFKQNKFAEGLSLGVDGIIKTLGPTPYGARVRKPSVAVTSSGTSGLIVLLVIIAVVAIVLLGIWLLGRGNSRKNWETSFSSYVPPRRDFPNFVPVKRHYEENRDSSYRPRRDTTSPTVHIDTTPSYNNDSGGGSDSGFGGFGGGDSGGGGASSDY